MRYRFGIGGMGQKAKTTADSLALGALTLLSVAVMVVAYDIYLLHFAVRHRELVDFDVDSVRIGFW